ncbi:MAG: TraR/DksA C4-type zinc finger protein [Owenweeksia sp.]|nr:TraR/DksA C4-type zinc finger protein [Owenweeksia sp.]
MNEQELSQLENLVQQEIAKTEKQVKEYRELTQPIAPAKNAIGRVSRMDAINNRSVTEAALRTAEKKLKGLKNILPKLNEPEFGQCRRCNKQIPIQRLLLMPHSPFCVNWRTINYFKLLTERSVVSGLNSLALAFFLLFA